MNTGNFTGASFVFTTSYKELTGLSTSFVLASPSQDFAMTTDGRLKYTGINAKIFSASASCYTASATNRLTIKIYKNGSAITGATSYSNNNKTFIDWYPVSLSTNDYLSVFAFTAPATTQAVTSISLSAKFMGGS